MESMKYKIMTIMFMLFLDCYSQNNIDLSSALDTIYLREFVIDTSSIESLELTKRFDELLNAEDWLKELKYDQCYLISVGNESLCYLPSDVDTSEGYYINISVMKRGRTMLFAYSGVVGYCKYKDHIWFIRFDSCINNIFEYIPGKQRSFVFYDEFKIYDIDRLTYFDFIGSLEGKQYKVIHDGTWLPMGGATIID